MASIIQDRKTYLSEGGAIPPNRLVKVGTASTQVALATAADAAFGVTQGDAAEAAKPIPVELLAPGKIVTIEAAGVIADKAAVVTAADGKVQTVSGLASGTYYKVGVAEEAAAADGSEVMIRILASLGDTYTVS